MGSEEIGAEQLDTPHDRSFRWTPIDEKSKATIRQHLLRMGVDMTPVEALEYHHPDGTFDDRGDFIEEACEETLSDPTMPKFVGHVDKPILVDYVATSGANIEEINITTQPLLFVNFNLPNGNPAIVLCRYGRTDMAVYERARNAFLSNVNQRFRKEGISEFPTYSL